MAGSKNIPSRFDLFLQNDYACLRRSRFAQKLEQLYADTCNNGPIASCDSHKDCSENHFDEEECLHSKLGVALI